MNSRVEDVMTRDVVAVRETAGYKDIIAAMRQRHVSAFPVLDSADHLVGVVSEADLLLKEVGLEALAGYLIATGRRGERAKAAGVTAAELMSKPALTIGPGESVAAAARRMHDRRVKRLPVVDDAGRLVGIVSRVDVLSVFGRPDNEIRDEVVKKIIVVDFTLDPDVFDVTVRSGIVTITGQVENPAVTLQLIDALQHVEGVVDVRNRISHPPADQPKAAVFLRPRAPG
ncbi:MAG TPA: CBS domain-containing protein [Streptosporangiaceae bacterium]|nr:CBS domain-containing protein [Streptosporangiaceae bacterium]